MKETNNLKFICPVHVGENNYVAALKQNVLVKFADFDLNLYPDSVKACAPAPEKAAPSSRQAAPRSREAAAVTDTDDANADQEEGEAEGNEEAPGQSNENHDDSLTRNQPIGLSSKCVYNPNYLVEYLSVSLIPTGEGEGEETIFDIELLFNASGDGSEDGAPIDIGTDPVSLKLWATANAGDSLVESKIGAISPSYDNIFTKDQFTVYGTCTFSSSYFTAEFIKNFYFHISVGEDLTSTDDDEFAEALILMPGSELSIPCFIPVCAYSHPLTMTQSDDEFVCESCGNSKCEQHWVCLECECLGGGTNHCMHCTSIPVMTPYCDNEHPMDEFGKGESCGYYPACDICGYSQLVSQLKYYHCDHCKYDLCLACAFNKCTKTDE